MRARLPHIPSAALGPIAVISLLVLLIVSHCNQPQQRIALPAAVQEPGAPHFPVPDVGDLTLPWPELSAAALSELEGIHLPQLGLPLGEFVQRTDLQINGAGFIYGPHGQRALESEAAIALAYVSDRFGHGPAHSLRVSLQREPTCNLHGAAYTEQRHVQLFTCPDIGRERVVSILAHELVHQLAHDHYGAAHLNADMILLEGLATWGAGTYWLGDQGSFRAYARRYGHNDTLLPLQTSYVGRSVGEMNQLYYQWASFVEFLLETYGRERFDALYTSGAQAPGSADYVGVYGKDLPTLEREWLEWLLRG
jgi:hypothetical protein